jgi:hypothetical protein
LSSSGGIDGHIKCPNLNATEQTISDHISFNDPVRPIAASHTF